MVTEHEHRDRSRHAARSSSHATCSARQHPARHGRASWCRAPPASRRGARPRRARPRRPASGRASRRGCRARGACASPKRAVNVSRNACVLLGAPGVGEIALHDDRVGIEPRHLRRPRARPITSGYGGVTGLGAQDRADRVGRGVAGAPALRLAEVDVVGGGDGRDQLARRLHERAHRRRQPAVGRHAVDREARTRCRGRGRRRARRGTDRWWTTSWSPTRVVTTARARVVNVTTTSSGPTLMSSAYAGLAGSMSRVRPGCVDRCARTFATGPAAVPTGARLQPGRRAPTRGACRRPRVSTAARDAATRRRGDDDRRNLFGRRVGADRRAGRRRRSPTAARCRACATAAARASCAAWPASGPARAASRAGRSRRRRSRARPRCTGWRSARCTRR